MSVFGLVFLSLSDSTNKLITGFFFLWLISFCLNDLTNDDSEEEGGD